MWCWWLRDLSSLGSKEQRWSSWKREPAQGPPNNRVLTLKGQFPLR
jgi:hypothetical protein